MQNGKIYIDKYDMFYNLMCLILVIELFFPPLFEFAGFRFEWPYICGFALFLNFLLSKKYSQYQMVYRDYLYFWCWCLLLLTLGVFRFTSGLILVGAAHTLRMFVMFVPYLWILMVIDDEKRLDFYKVLRIYLMVCLILLFIIGIYQGGISNINSFRTIGVGKNSLGYTIVCIQVLFSLYENEDVIRKPFKNYIWLPLCLLVCIFTKSGTAVAFGFLALGWYLFKNLNIRLTGKLLLLVIVCFAAVLFLNIDILIEIFQALHVSKLSEFFYSFKYSGGTSLGTTTDVRLGVQERVLKEFDIKMAIGRFYYYYFAIHGYTAHQLYLQILYDTGIIGILLFLRFCFSNIVLSRNKIAVLLILLYSTIEVFFIQYAGLIIFALIVSFKGNKIGEEYENSISSSICIR